MVYAVGSLGGRPIIWEIEEFRQSRETELFLNEPDKPVILMLSGDYVDVWQIWRTPATKIAAVYVEGEITPRVLGLNESTPLMVTSERDRQCEKVVYSSPISLNFIDVMADMLFDQLAVQKISALDASRTFTGQSFIGLQLPVSSYIQDRVQLTESLRIPNTPLTGQAGLDEAVQNGEIRAATQAEINQLYQE